VAVTDLSPEAAHAVVDSIAAAGGRAKAFAHDVTLPEDWERVVEEVEAAFGRLDILVNNAGMTTVGNELMSHSLENWRRTLSVNLDGVFYGHRFAGPLILKGGRGGSVINLSSIMGKIATPGAAAYCASKGAVLMLTKAAALEWAPLGIRVNSVHPGYVETPLVHNILREVENGNEVRETLVPPARPRPPRRTRRDRQRHRLPRLRRGELHDWLGDGRGWGLYGAIGGEPGLTGGSGSHARFET